MKPGATTRPPASMVLFVVPEIFPTSAIFPCAIPMLARFAGAPVPSTTMPFLIRISRAMRHDTRKKKRALSGPFRDCPLHWLETIAAILWHTARGMTAHYSVAQVAELVEALNRITDERHRTNRSLAMIAREALEKKSPNLPAQMKSG